MKYLFSGFALDTEKKELYFKEDSVYLTKHMYQLLLFLVQNSQTILDKEMLIEHVWKGRIVADNSIDQGIYKLKKQLNAINEDEYFETVYGHGVRFLPEVSREPISENKVTIASDSRYPKIIITIIALAFVLISLFVWTNKKGQPLINKINDDFISILLLPPLVDKQNNSWLKNSSNLMFEKILNTSVNISLKNYRDKPSNLTRQQYLDTQWKISPNLKVVTTDIYFKNSLFTVTINSIDKQGNEQIKSFHNQNLNSAYLSAIKWFSNQVHENSTIDLSNSLIPENTNLLELYIRGLSAFANNNVKKAINYFELCIEEQSDYIPALIELAKVHDINGDKAKALSILDSAKYSDKGLDFEVQIVYLRGTIQFIQGKAEEVEINYLNLLNKYNGMQSADLSLVKIKLAEIYKYQSKNQDAIKILNDTELYFSSTNNIENLAQVLQRKGSLLLKMNNVKEARKTIGKALNIFTKLGNLYGVAANTAITARIDSREAKYDSAIEHLQQALNIMKKIDNKRGIGATLNEIIALLITQGKLNQAQELNESLERIALEIDFTGLLLASKLFKVNISELNKKWVTIEIILKEHLELATAVNFKYGITHNKLLEISMLIGQEKIENIMDKINQVQELINQDNSLNWQPMLDINTAKYYFLIEQAQKGVSLLTATKQSLIENKNIHYLVELNNVLASHYLKTNQPKKVLSILEENNSSFTIPYPTLLFKSKANFALGNIAKAVEQASYCKNSSYDLWKTEDEAYLSKIKGRK